MMSLIKALLLSLILVLPGGIATTIFIMNDDQEIEVLQNLNSEEEDERGADENSRETDCTPCYLVYHENPANMEMLSQNRNTYRNRHFMGFQPDVLTPPPKVLV